MPKSIFPRVGWLSAASIVAALGAFSGAALISGCEVCEAATSILLTGVVPAKCTIGVSPNANASNLPLTAAGAQHVVVGSVLQNCTGTRSYVITVNSPNCPTAPAGGKLIDPVSGDALAYSTEFTNPPTGGSQQDVTGLMANSCAYQVGRYVIAGHVVNETSTVYLNYTGSSSLSAGTYQDTIVVSISTF